jgi:cell fate (sporulation/competence/biofilm development) regulator YlbF (YheA/YmcA/DUF963 family)
MTNNGNPIHDKTLELCQALAEDSQFKSIRQRIDAFQNDQQAMALYAKLNQKREQLESKQQEGHALTNEEVADFEANREIFLKNEVACGFIDAQQEIHDLRKRVNQYVTKTFELGRMPAPEEMEDASCGHGCGCHH